MPEEDINKSTDILDKEDSTNEYDEVVDSTKKNVKETMEDKTKNFSDKSNHAQKAKSTWHEKNVLKPLQNNNNEKMDIIFMNWSNLICNYVNDFINKPENKFILDQILALNPWDSMTFEIKKEKVKCEWWGKFVWDPISLKSPESFKAICEYFHNFCSKNKSFPKPWEISSSIVIKKDKNNPKLLELHAEQFEYPDNWDSGDIFFYNPDVNDKDFQDIINSKTEGKDEQDKTGEEKDAEKEKGTEKEATKVDELDEIRQAEEEDIREMEMLEKLKKKEKKIDK